MDPDIAKHRAEALFDDAIDKSHGSRLSLFSGINSIFWQERWAVRDAIRKNPVFDGIVDDAVRTLIEVCLKDVQPDDSGKIPGDKVMPYFHQVAMDAHPELAAAYVMSAVRIFGEKRVVFGTLDDRRLRALEDHIKESDGREMRRVEEAIGAINRLGQMVKKPTA